ncbi:MAG: hypothetical protein NVS1B1_00020 [Candidatus Limnocylindrales bacterium]
MGALQPLHLLVILVIVLVVFGAGRLGEVGSALGKGVKDFRSSVEGDPNKHPATGVTGSGFCPKCGTPRPVGDARFCVECGGPLPV